MRHAYKSQHKLTGLARQTPTNQGNYEHSSCRITPFEIPESRDCGRDAPVCAPAAHT